MENSRAAPTGNRSQTSLNAETQSFAENRREKEPSATLCETLRFCVKASQPGEEREKPLVPVSYARRKLLRLKSG